MRLRDRFVCYSIRDGGLFRSAYSDLFVSLCTVRPEGDKHVDRFTPQDRTGTRHVEPQNLGTDTPATAHTAHCARKCNLDMGFEVLT